MIVATDRARICRPNRCKDWKIHFTPLTNI